MPDKFPDLSPFALAFAEEYLGFMKSKKVTGAQIAEKLGRNAGYVSERINGKRALDTEDIDALASLVGGWSGTDLMIELARRARVALQGPGGEVIEGRFGVAPSVEDDLDAVARPTDPEPDEEPS